MTRNHVVTDHHIDTAWREACATTLAGAPGADHRDAGLATPAFASGFRGGVAGTLLVRGLSAYASEDGSIGARTEYRAGHDLGRAWRAQHEEGGKR